MSMLAKLKFLMVSILSIGIAYPALAEGGGEGGGNQQSPIQAIVQIAISAIVLKILGRFKLP
jgi:hypothetical protein